MRVSSTLARHASLPRRDKALPQASIPGGSRDYSEDGQGLKVHSRRAPLQPEPQRVGVRPNEQGKTPHQNDLDCSRVSAYQVPELGIEAQRSAEGSGWPRCISSMEMRWGDRTNATRPADIDIFVRRNLKLTGSRGRNLDFHPGALSGYLADQKGAGRANITEYLAQNRRNQGCGFAVGDIGTARNGIGEARTGLAQCRVDRGQRIASLLGGIGWEDVVHGITPGRA